MRYDIMNNRKIGSVYEQAAGYYLNSMDMRFYNIIIAVMPERLILLREMVRILYFVK